MAPDTFEALAVILLAVVPGFLATSAWARAKTWKGRGNDLYTVLQSLAASLVIQVVASPLTIGWLYPLHSNLLLHPWVIAVWLFVVVLLLPLAGGILFGHIEDLVFSPARIAFGGRIRTLIGRVVPPSPPPTIWDWFFTNPLPESCFLVIEFDDGSRVAGAFSRGSTALTSPEPPGLYLVKEWSLDQDGNLVAEVPGTAGVIITRGNVIRSVRVLIEPDSNAP